MLLVFSSISSIDGSIGFFVIISPRDLAPHTQYGKSLGHMHFPLASIKAFFTALSSNEWKVITHNLPFDFRASILFVIVVYNGFISLFTSILIAWNVLLAGCPSFCFDFGIEFSIISTNCFVVSISFFSLSLQIFLAICLENLSSPYSYIIFASSSYL